MYPFCLHGNQFRPASYQGKPFSGEKIFPGPLSNIRCGISLAAIGKHYIIIVVNEEILWTSRQGFLRMDFVAGLIRR